MPQRISAKMGGLPSSTGQLPSAADGSRIDAIPNGRIASAANTNGRAGPFRVACQGLRHLRSPPAAGLGLWGVLGGTCALSPCLALRHGGHLRYPPLTQFPGGRQPPCPTECPRSRRCPRRGRSVLRRAPRPSMCSGR